MILRTSLLIPYRPTVLRGVHTASSWRSPPRSSDASTSSSILSSLSDSTRIPGSTSSSQSTSSQTPSSTASASDLATDAVRAMINTLARNRPDDPLDERRRFAPSTLIRPSELTQASLFAPRRPSAKAPLLGPSKKVAIQIDPFYQANSSPIDHTLNPTFSLAFLNPLGRVRGRNETGLTRRSQRHVGKMVRRARAMGLISKFSDRPAVGGYGSTASGRGLTFARRSYE